MKNWAIKIFLISLFFATLYAGSLIEYFTATNYSDGKVRLEWKSGEENLYYYQIERKTPQTSFVEIAKLQPEGDNSVYHYDDEAAYKTADVFFTYRLKIIDGSPNPSYIDANVSSGTSDVTKRTWGSIKAMFR